MRTLAVTALAALLLTGTAAAGNAQRGQRLFGQFCAACHAEGKTRIGAGPGREMRQQTAVAPSLRGVGAMAAHFYLSTGYMPLKRTGIQPRRGRLLLGAQQIADLTAYVASLGGGPAVPHPHPERGNLSEGFHLFTEHCAGCHQVVAQGGYVTGALPPALVLATPVQVAQAVRIGPYVMPAFSEKAISKAELDSIVKYVLYARHPDDRGGWSLGDIGPIPEGLTTWFLAMSVLLAVCIVLGKRLRG